MNTIRFQKEAWPGPGRAFREWGGISFPGSPGLITLSWRTPGTKEAGRGIDLTRVGS
jgi:hypothetical protein